MEGSEQKTSNYVVISKIPAPVGVFRRSASVRVRGEKANMMSLCDSRSRFPSISEKEEFSFGDNRSRKRLSLSLNRSRSQTSVLNGHFEDDLDSLDSFASNISAISTKSSCEHAHFAKNGTTYSGRLHRYIVHCSAASNEPEEYLTPTQRANRKIKRLKTLLQLAKEKLREKEEEIFKLTKEVVELKVFKASVNSPYSEGNSPSEHKEISSEKEENSVINCDASVQALNSPDDLQKLKDLPCDTYNDFSPMKASFYFEDNNDELLKLSPVSPQHCFNEKLSATPDFLLSSLADSGNFDDLASSVSLHSKDSIGFTITPDLRHPPGETIQDGEELFELKDGDDEKLKILNAYENKLKEKKLEYEIELKRIVDEQEGKNIRMMRDFEDKLKEEELKFEERWMKLLKTSEDEKQAIVDRFERKLAEEKEKYMEDFFKSQGRKSSESLSGEAYVRTVEEEKSIYESSLQRIKSKFENEKSLIEKNYDETMKQERKKFEESVLNIKEISDCRIQELLNTIAEIEARHKELQPKFEELQSRNMELEKENKSLKEALDEQEERHKNVYLKLYQKGQEAAKLEHASQIAECAQKAPNKVPIPELLVQLKVTEAELENLKDKEYRAFHTDDKGLCLLSSKEAVSLWILAARKAMYKRLAEAQEKCAQAESRNHDSNAEATLQFLKSAVYYFLTDRENHMGHLRAIESILGFSADEKSNIEKHYSW